MRKRKALRCGSEVEFPEPALPGLAVSGPPSKGAVEEVKEGSEVFGRKREGGVEAWVAGGNLGIVIRRWIVIGEGTGKIGNQLQEGSGCLGSIVSKRGAQLKEHMP